MLSRWSATCPATSRAESTVAASSRAPASLQGLEEGARRLVAERLGLTSLGRDERTVSTAAQQSDQEPKSIVQLPQALGLSVTWLQSTRGEKTAGVAADNLQLSMLPSGGRAGARAAAAPKPRQHLGSLRSPRAVTKER
jgi:hypothetical protein